MPIDEQGRAYEVVDLTPTPDGYRMMLRRIIEATTCETNRLWASVELDRVLNVQEWGPQ